MWSASHIHWKASCSLPLPLWFIALIADVTNQTIEWELDNLLLLFRTYFSSNGYLIFIAFVIALFLFWLECDYWVEIFLVTQEYALELDEFPVMLTACDWHACNCVFLDRGNKISSGPKDFSFLTPNIVTQFHMNIIKMPQFIKFFYVSIFLDLRRDYDRQKN